MMHNESSYVTIYLISGKELNFCMVEDMRNKIVNYPHLTPLVFEMGAYKSSN